MMLVLPVHGRGCQVILLKTAENLAGGCMFNEIERDISLVCSWFRVSSGPMVKG